MNLRCYKSKKKILIFVKNPTKRSIPAIENVVKEKMNANAGLDLLNKARPHNSLLYLLDIFF